MMSLHPTRREILLVIVLTLILGLFLQFDLSVRFTESPRSEYLPNLQLGYGRGRPSLESERKGGHGAWLDDDEEDEVKKIQRGKEVTSMADAKLRWGEEGPARTEVMAHAPGKLLGLYHCTQS
jgi:hypothetical protein